MDHTLNIYVPLDSIEQRLEVRNGSYREAAYSTSIQRKTNKRGIPSGVR